MSDPSELYSSYCLLIGIRLDLSRPAVIHEQEATTNGFDERNGLGHTTTTATISPSSGFIHGMHGHFMDISPGRPQTED